MPRVYFITHPEVAFDWAVPVTRWDLSEKGRLRLEKLVAQPWAKSLQRVFASTEVKAITTGRRLAEACGTKLTSIAELSEIERSATGILPPEEYSAVTEAFFADPQQSARGWERAVDAQRRIVAAVESIVAQTGAEGHIAIVSHGGVGTLLLCHLMGIAIRRAEDQPGQGHYFVFDSGGGVVHGWRRIDESAG